MPSVAATELIGCVYRVNTSDSGEEPTAQCLLLSQMLGLASEQCPVTRSMCQACVQQTRQRIFSDHPIFPSLVYHLASEQLSLATEPGEQARWEKWIERAEEAFLKETQPPPPTVSGYQSCDVLLLAEGDMSSVGEAVATLLDQTEAVPILHLIESENDPHDWGDLATRWNVQIHRFAGPLNFVAIARRIQSSLRTPHLAIQSPRSTNAPLRLAASLGAIRDCGAELFVSAVPDLEAETEEAAVVLETQRPPLVPWSLVVRRATFVDIVEAPSGALLETEADFIKAALRQGRPVAISADPLVMIPGPDRLPPEGIITGLPRTMAPPPERVHPIRPAPTKRPYVCDVVLPFRGQLDYVREALNSLLQQAWATPIIHLVDDATPFDISDFLNEWATHPQLRIYRNRENVGQFQSFNNTAAYWETDLVAVQDADDISLPHRLYSAARLLDLTGADYFGGAVELFGDEDLIRPVMAETTTLERIPRAEYRRSFYPEWAKSDYFLENPTAVFRVAMFRELGGYADFGTRLMNRTSLDTEFQLRCLYHGVRFAITRDIVTRYRVHPESATQDRQTGWGTSPRALSIRQVEERCRVFRNGGFDPRTFGALGRYAHLTERWTGPS